METDTRGEKITMKKRGRKHNCFLGFIFWITVLVLIFVGLNSLLVKIDSYSVRKGYVESVEGNLVTVIDTSGTRWGWEEEKDTFHKWDKVKMLMDNNNTINTEKDDIILKISVDK